LLHRMAEPTLAAVAEGGRARISLAPALASDTLSQQQQQKREVATLETGRVAVRRRFVGHHGVHD